ncbi:MAG: Methylated-DNA/protein-cysteine methyltransferase [Candidatus Collierbacteria bacterium GW2011_GWB1_44_6]|uniref:Methylated-DNA/protein-cysteine methyltransferase n=2 Tax=Candidatus Collieribacteriota TaxID=1752725 RepID=A0A0G1MNN9_9BACT|nr:MAG: Methylated-DNA/protein-cysteine methyltransferase [Candidatus Collierbacteria bacterium GW2011_GWC2_43_12]KKT73609.1 MAG: Methylated-DNA/protein-cysteine methyltransferase [Candidatus Collierbacteria bacterium GW2011_GWB1_44_6]KKT84170.1 MAG: Methylated-DNA/protein-cysteine methyltransferase [Microgenomates group bacterium GW2011_GWC1_44_9]
MKFAQKVYKILRQVPAGKVITYKRIAEKLGTKAYRAVGQALKNNPYAPDVPCHRVVRSDGSIGGFQGKTTGQEVMNKIMILKREGVEVINFKVVDFQKKLFNLI